MTYVSFNRNVGKNKINFVLKKKKSVIEYKHETIHFKDYLTSFLLVF